MDPETLVEEVPAMPVFFNCPCGARLRLAESLVGQPTRCPACNRVQLVSSGSEDRPHRPVEVPPPPEPAKWVALRCEQCGETCMALQGTVGQTFRCPACVGQDRAPPAPGLDVVEEIVEEEEAPRRKRAKRAAKRSKSIPGKRWRLPLLYGPIQLAHWIKLRVLLIGLALGPILVLANIQELNRSLDATRLPQPLTLGELASRGLGSSNHVALTGFTPGKNIVIFYKESRTERIWRGLSGKEADPVHWESVSVPLFEGPDRRRVVAVVHSHGVHNKFDLEQWRTRQEIRGMIGGKLSLKAEVGKALQEMYPGADLSNCYSLDEGRTPTSRGWSAAWLGFGFFLTLVAGSLLGLRLLYPC